MTTTLTTISLNLAGDELIHAVRMYNSLRNHPSPLCDEEAETVILASLAGEHVLEPLRRFVERVGSEDWDESNIFAVHVRGAWLQTVAALNEDVGLEDEELEDEEDFSIGDLKTYARSLMKGNLYRKRFERLLEDAVRLEVSDEELREALYQVIDSCGLVSPMEEFVSSTAVGRMLEPVILLRESEEEANSQKKERSGESVFSRFERTSSSCRRCRREPR